ncbi:uncharacterized protein LOC133204872 [Saccostrea echinata]|uniref:uncharacterized protein LOC133204872 n=1 Tax=Saccostrea echinata TaxID=191078 RepID=UPI002A82FB76|nr:uncharacterized protein LOC133204872 [Saccostrea echinata]
MWRRSLLDVRVKRSADVGSDHHLVTALIKIKLKKAKARPKTQARFEIQRLNRPSPDETIAIPEATEDLDIDTDPPTKDEIMDAIKTLKNEKSQGCDNLDAELFKADPGIAASILQTLLTAVWDGEKVPDDWFKGVNGKELRQTDNFIHLGGIIKPEGDTKEDIHSRLGRARGVIREMNNIWRSAKYSTSTKLKLYQSCVISTLLYGSECWRITEADLTNLRSFHTICLRRILRIFWPEKVTNEDLLSRCIKEDMGTIITKCRWRWIGHVLRKKP